MSSVGMSLALDHLNGLACRAGDAAKAAVTAADAGSDDAEALVREAQSRIDRAVLRGVLHKNTAAHRKARLAKHLADAQA